MIKVKILVSNEGELLYCLACLPKTGFEYNMYENPTNSNQLEMFCASCHRSLGFDQRIEDVSDCSELFDNMTDSELQKAKENLEWTIKSRAERVPLTMNVNALPPSLRHLISNITDKD